MGGFRDLPIEVGYRPAMTPSFVVALSLPLLLSGASPVLASAGSAPSFGWPRSGQVRVVETITRADGSSKIRYTLELSAHGADKKGLRIRYDDIQVLEVDGRKPTKEEAKQIARVASNLPDVIVDAKGRGRDIAGLERVTNRLAKYFADDGDLKQAVLLKHMAKDPKTVAAFKHAALQVWRAWVGVWRDAGPAGDDITRRESTALLPGGAALDVPTRLVNQGADSSGEARLLYEAEVTPERSPKAARALEKQVAERTGIAAKQVSGVRALLRFEARIQLSTLRPREVRTERTVEVDLGAKGGKHTDREAHVYAFDWSASAP